MAPPVEPQPPHRRFLPWPAVLGIWTLVSLAFAMSTYVAYSLKGDPVPFSTTLYWSFADWYLWALMAPAVWWLDRRFPLDRLRWRRSLPVHLLGWVGAVLVHETGYVLLERAAGLTLGPPMPLSRNLVLYFFKRAAFDLLVYGVLVGLSCMVNIYRRYQERELRASQLESQLTRAQLDALRSQLQPHFLFNTLNTISSLIHSDTAAAERVVSRLGDLLRLSLQHTGLHELPLRDELEFLGHYVEIQKSRFRDRLSVRVDVPADTLDAMVPTFVLQPLVENAVRHGLEPRPEPGLVEVRARRESGQLVLEVADNGAGLAEQPAGGNGNGRGIGLTNTRARLAQLYGPAHSISLSNRAEGGVVVRLVVPYRSSEE